ncbi:MAG: hypothetical protein MJ151_04015, partial [Lachnospiraceae bacterium]|nr:hypothetical protein [Lachnospiraceae bacterium]
MRKEDIKVNNILDLTKTDYEFLFKGIEYVYEVLPLIKLKFDDVVRSLDYNEYNRIKDGVFVHKSVTVLKSVFLGRNIVIGKDVEIRNSALLRENIVVGDNCLIGNSCELKNTI